jgi:Protein of unknown function (DUF3089)
MNRSLRLGAMLILLGISACSEDDGDGGTQTNDVQGGGGSSGSAPAAGGGTTGGAGDGGDGAGSGSQPTAGTGGATQSGAGNGGTPGSGGSSGGAAGDDAGVDAGGGAGTDGRDPNAVNPYPGFTSEIYGQDEMWMCKPGLAQNYCLEDIAEATEALPDGTFKPFMDELGTDHPIDCIFWYPTVNRTEDPTSYDFSDPEPMLSSIRSQAARFSRVCNVYAPFYRQASLNNGGNAELGYMDVVESFKHYIANWSEGRSFVVYGHSQGTGHASRLINQEINDNPDLRGRLVSALMIGGGLTADTFSNIPLCTAPDQVGCAIGYRAYGVPQSLSSISADLACTNPGALGGGKVLMKGAFFRSRGTNYSSDLGAEFTAPWGLFRDFFTAECVAAPSGGEVLQIDYTDAPGDMRPHFLDLSRVIGFGLHVFDYQFPLDDLVELVRTQREAKLAAMP